MVTHVHEALCVFLLTGIVQVQDDNRAKEARAGKYVRNEADFFIFWVQKLTDRMAKL